MKKLFVIGVLLLLVSNCWGRSKDTTFYENGQIESVFKRFKFSKDYYRNGTLKKKVVADKLWRRGKEANFDSLGVCISKGRLKFGFRKHGNWKTFENGKKTSKTPYKFGYVKDSLRTESGKMKRCILTRGLHAWSFRSCEDSQEKYGLTYIAVAGCVSTRRLKIKSGFHNFFVELRMRMKYGSGWEEEIESLCKKTRT